MKIAPSTIVSSHQMSEELDLAARDSMLRHHNREAAGEQTDRVEIRHVEDLRVASAR